MSKVRKTIIILMSLIIFSSLFVVVFAGANINTEDMSTSSTVNPFEYSKTPDGLYVFRYYGISPYTSVDIDTSDCTVGRLYVYNSINNSLIEIINQPVTLYSYTQTNLYYMTEDQKIYKTDYSGTNHEYLYQCTIGSVRNLKNYLDTLYFIEDESRIMLLDVSSKTVQEVWECENLDWAIMLNPTQLVATTATEDNYLYDISTNTATIISSIEATNLVTAAVKGTASNLARATTIADFNNIVLTQENDISFPLSSYSAEPDDYFNSSLPQYSGPSSWFHVNGLEGCSSSNCKKYAGAGECMGFARYAHDAYLHIENESITDWAWKNTPCITKYDAPVGNMTDNPVADADPTKLKLFNGDAQLIKEFFNQLNTGAYVRYGKYKDTSRSDGCHSIVFIARDDTGIWAYECNQDYVISDPNDYYGCGVFIQYYTYVDLDKYEFIINYVNHSFTGDIGYYNANYHNVSCQKCSGFVRQAHTGATYQVYNQLQHRVTFTCCGGSILEKHNYVFNGSGSYVCTGCYADRDGFSDILSLEQLADLYDA